MKNKLHVVCEYAGTKRFYQHWQECFKHSDFDDFEVNIIEGTVTDPHLHENVHLGTAYYDNAVFNNILGLVKSNKVKSGDIFIFSNGFNFIAPTLKYFLNLFGKKVRLVGFWNLSIHERRHPDAKGSKIRTRKIELAQEEMLLKTYDLNCFFSEETIDKFSIWPARSKCHVTGFPFGYIADEVDVNEDEKENIILFPHDVLSDVQNNIFNAINNNLKHQFQFVRVVNEYNNRGKYKGLLEVSKVLFCSAVTEFNPSLIYECMCYGVRPIIPDTALFANVFPERYQYSSEFLSKDPMKLLRRFFQLEDTVELGMYDYDYTSVINDAKLIGEKYFKNESFKNLLC